jgi:hypothetical protein
MIPPHVQLVDRNGVITQEWWRFLNSLDSKSTGTDQLQDIRSYVFDKRDPNIDPIIKRLDLIECALNTNRQRNVTDIINRLDNIEKLLMATRLWP